MLAVITVVYNNYQPLNEFFTTLLTQSEHNFTVFVVDVSDTDKRQMVPAPLPIRLLTAPNRGYGAALNVGIRAALNEGITEFATTNNDILFHPDAIKHTRSALHAHPLAIIGAKIYYAPGFEYHNRYKESEKGRVLWFAGGTINWAHATAAHRGVDEVDNGQYETKEPTDYVTGCFMAFTHEVIKKVGFLSEEYFMYYEDADFCIRAKKLGIPSLFVPSIIIWHKETQSSGGGKGSDLRQTLVQKNRIKFFLKYAPLTTRLHIIKNLLLKKNF